MDKRALKRALDIALLQVEYVIVDAGFFFSWNTPPLMDKGQGVNLCVLTPEPMSIKRAAQAIRDINRTDCDFWPILNRQGAPGSIPQEQIESCLGTALQGFIPDESAQMMSAMNASRPLYMANPDSGFSRAMDELATRLAKTV